MRSNSISPGSFRPRAEPSRPAAGSFHDGARARGVWLERAGMRFALQLPMRGKFCVCVSLLLAIVAVHGCADTTSSFDPLGSSDESAAAGDTDPPAALGSACATTSQCEPGLFCSETGRCIRAGKCDTNADCSAQGWPPHCDLAGDCQQCFADVDCPMDRPLCVQHWESGTYCSVCRIGDSSHCPSGSWCSNPSGPFSGEGPCVAADCEHDRQGAGCTACINEHAQLCLAPGAACQATFDDFSACLQQYGSDDAPCSIPKGIPARTGCVPDACAELASGLDACLYACDAALAACAVPR
jgi:hypothetical protein